MSYYKVDGADLTAIANKIRSKGGTSAQLAFPDDFEDAVDAIVTPTGTKQITAKSAAREIYLTIRRSPVG